MWFWPTLIVRPCIDLHLTDACVACHSGETPSETSGSVACALCPNASKAQSGASKAACTPAAAEPRRALQAFYSCEQDAQVTSESQRLRRSITQLTSAGPAGVRLKLSMHACICAVLQDPGAWGDSRKPKKAQLRHSQTHGT